MPYHELIKGVTQNTSWIEFSLHSEAFLSAVECVRTSCFSTVSGTAGAPAAQKFAHGYFVRILFHAHARRISTRFYGATPTLTVDTNRTSLACKTQEKPTEPTQHITCHFETYVPIPTAKPSLPATMLHDNQRYKSSSVPEEHTQ